MSLNLAHKSGSARLISLMVLQTKITAMQKLIEEQFSRRVSFQPLSLEGRHLVELEMCCSSATPHPTVPVFKMQPTKP
jgi:hypothetical protein